MPGTVASILNIGSPWVPVGNIHSQMEQSLIKGMSPELGVVCREVSKGYSRT